MLIADSIRDRPGIAGWHNGILAKTAVAQLFVCHNWMKKGGYYTGNSAGR
jgi:hypothetical protein